MFIIWGSRSRIKVTDAVGVRATCPSCHVESQFIEKQVVTYFTLYFIPLFPVQRGMKFVECQYCQAKFQQTLDELRARSAQAEQERVAEAAARDAAAQQRQDELGRLRQRWSEAPEDRVSLVRLLDMLAEDGQYTELLAMEPAIRERYGEDPDLVIRLGHAAFALKRYDDAASDYEQLVTANPYRGDARFYLASSCWYMDPPQFDRAVEHMQIAADMGYPAASEALPRLKKARAEAPLTRWSAPSPADEPRGDTEAPA